MHEDKRSVLLSAIGAHIGDTYCQSNGILIDNDTRFDTLNFSLIDECYLQHLARKCYELPNLNLEKWPDTIGEYIDIVERQFKDNQVLSNGFADNDNLIYISYAGGACGHAMRYVLLTSPGTDGFDGDDSMHSMDKLGSAHQLLSRSGIGHRYGDVIRPIALNDVPDMLHMSPLAWYDGRVYPRLIDHSRQHINCAVTADGRDSRYWRDFGKWIWSDHVPPQMARYIFPNAKIVAIYRNPSALSRDFVLKRNMETIEPWLVDQGFDPGMLNIDFQLSKNRYQNITRMAYKDYITFQIEWQIHMQDVILEQAQQLGIHIMDMDRMLDNRTRHEEYHKLMSHLHMPTDYAKADQFLSAYVDKQYRRDTWKPNMEWQWVKLGPNRQGLW